MRCPPYKRVTLYNKENKFTYEKQIYKDNGEPFIMPDAGVILTERDNWTRTKRYAIVKEALQLRKSKG